MKTKKLLSILLTAMMLLSLVMMASAASDGSVEITGAANGEKYTLYKVFDLTYSGDKVAYSYTKTAETDSFFTALQGEGSLFTAQATTTENVYNITLKNAATDGKDIATWLKANLPTAGGDEKTAAGGTVKWENLAYGYYYVTSTTGSVVIVDSTLKDVTIADKNSVPSADKQQAIGEGGYGNAAVSANVGDTVKYQVIVKDGKGTDKEIKIVDTMSAGLTNNKDVAVYKGSVSEGNKVTASDSTYTLTNEGDSGFTLTLTEAYVRTLTDVEADNIIIQYSATVNESAVTASEDGSNNNQISVTYSNQTTTDTVEVNTYKFQIVKDDSSNKVLTGAKFKIYDAATGGNEVPVVKMDDGNYRHAKNGETGVEIEAGTPVIRGLAAGTYYIEETEAPAGYNKLAARQSITIAGDTLATVNDDVYQSGGLEVENLTGAELPSTGGIGTTIFYILGGVLVVGAVVFLVTKKRADM